MKPWKRELVDALQALGGTATLDEIYLEVRRRRTNLTPQWQASVRGTLEHASSDSDTYRPGAPDLFYMAGRKGEGRWGLR